MRRLVLTRRGRPGGHVVRRGVRRQGRPVADVDPLDHGRRRGHHRPAEHGGRPRDDRGPGHSPDHHDRPVDGDGTGHRPHRGHGQRARRPGHRRHRQGRALRGGGGSHGPGGEPRPAPGRWTRSSAVPTRSPSSVPPTWPRPRPRCSSWAADETKTLTTTLVRLGDELRHRLHRPQPAPGRAARDPHRPLRERGRRRQRPGHVHSPGPVSGSSSAWRRAAWPTSRARCSCPTATGAVAWQVRCLAPGQFPASIIMGNASSALVLPPCTAAPPPPAAPATTTP